MLNILNQWFGVFQQFLESTVLCLAINLNSIQYSNMRIRCLFLLMIRKDIIHHWMLGMLRYTTKLWDGPGQWNSTKQPLCSAQECMASNIQTTVGSAPSFIRGIRRILQTLLSTCGTLVEPPKN